MADDAAFDDTSDTESEGIQFPLSVYNYFERWHYWYNVIVHRRDDIAPRKTHRYLQDHVTKDARPAPFPLSASETWYCGVLLALIIAVHNAVDESRVYKDVYPFLQWGGRVLGRALLTVGTAMLSTICFELIGSQLGRLFHWATMEVEEQISTFLIKRWHWGQVDGDGEPLRHEDGDFVWIADPAERRESIRGVLNMLAILAFDYLVTLFLKIGDQLTQMLVEHILGPFLYFFFAIPPGFTAKVSSALFLPTPGLDDIRDPRALWFEYGVPAVIQLCVVVFLWLLKILFMAKTERFSMRGWRVIDPKMALIWHLIRATAMHLLAYTAYQLVCGVIVALKSELPDESRYTMVIDGPISPFLGRVIPNGSIFAAALLLIFHWLLRGASVLGVELAQPLWVPYILWQTHYSEEGIAAYWPLFIDHLVNDVSVTDHRKRVTSRVFMTAVFGLQSSWPAMLNLSNLVDDN
ncbi:hypothetical protein F4802DRAFT_181523 [Xylaria palmicola]|nr:hypothetical protein F4802DRAFT_181523 [Xylaria palmicola]